MKKQQGHGLKTSLTVGALKAPVTRKSATATVIEIPTWWGLDEPKMPRWYGE